MSLRRTDELDEVAVEIVDEGHPPMRLGRRARRPHLPGAGGHDRLIAGVEGGHAAEVAALAPGAVTLAFPDRFAAEQAEKFRADIDAAVSEALGQLTRTVFSVGARAGSAVRSEVGVENDAAVADLGPTHVSAYSLIVEDGGHAGMLCSVGGSGGQMSVSSGTAPCAGAASS